MAVVFFLHGAVFQAKLAHEFHPSNFKPDGEVGVIHHAHVVRLCVADAEFSFACGAYFVQWALRLSRKADTPSWKPGVGRMAALSFTPCPPCRSSCSRV